MGEDHRIFVVLAVLMLLIFSGCFQQGPQGEAEKSQEKVSDRVQDVVNDVEGQKPKDSDIPVFQGSKIYTAPTFFYQVIGIPTEGVSVRVYYNKDATVNDIIKWYREKMKDYDVIEEMPVLETSLPVGSISWGGVLFQKDKIAVGIYAIGGMAVEGGKGVIYYLVKGSVEAFKGKREAIPEDDVVSGEEPIERYPESIMLSYEKDDNYIIITYGTEADPDTVFNWYKRYFSDNKWEIDSESKEKNLFSLEVRNENSKAGILIYPPDDTKSYTEIELHLGNLEKQKPEAVEPTSEFGETLHDLFSSLFGAAVGGDIILSSYSEMEFMGIMNVEMSYTMQYPLEDVSSVAQTIKKALSEKEFSSVFSRVTENSAELGFSGEIGGKKISMATINLYKGSDTITILVQQVGKT